MKIFLLFILTISIPVFEALKKHILAGSERRGFNFNPSPSAISQLTGNKIQDLGIFELNTKKEILKGRDVVVISKKTYNDLKNTKDPVRLMAKLNIIQLESVKMDRILKNAEQRQSQLIKEELNQQIKH